MARQCPLSHPRGQIAILSLLLILFAALTILPMRAVGEIYTLTMSASRIQETNNPGVTMTLNVTGAVVSTFYAFRWNVTTPAGNLTSLVNGQLTGPAQTNLVLTVVYPRDFTGASVKYNGTYRVSIYQINPPPTTLVASGKFAAGLTDSLVYQRTGQVSILAQGYRPNENVTIRVFHAGISLPFFQTSKLSDSNGILSYPWSIPVSALVGITNVTLTGQSTTKNPPDSQFFTVLSTNVTISQLVIGQSLLQRSQVADFHFTASYPNGVQVRTGSASIRIVEPDGVTFHLITATYSSATSAFQGNYRVPLDKPVGVWVASIEPNGFDDSFGNRGPSLSAVRGFAVQQATLTVTVLVGNKTYTPGDVVTVYATIVTPGNLNFTTGTVSASLIQGSAIGSPLNLDFDQTRGRWFGSFTVNATNPSGTWLIRVGASDPYGNAGQGSSQAQVVTSQPSLTSSYLLLTVAALAALAVLVSWVFFFGRRRILRRVLKVDLQAIEQEAVKVENQDFFKNIKEQLKQQKKPQDGAPNGE